MRYHTIKTEKHICNECLTDYFLINLVKTSNKKNDCSYCNRKQTLTIGLSKLLLLIDAAIPAEYDSYHEQEEANITAENYLGPFIKTKDLLQRLNFTQSSNLIRDISKLFKIKLWWNMLEFAGEPSSEAENFFYSWKRFCWVTKHISRYFFIDLHEEFEPCEEDTYFIPPINPITIIEYISATIKNLNLETILPKNTNIYRVIFTNKYKDIEFPGMPYPKYASNSRMSPLGIPMFYGALDIQTAIDETYNATQKKYVAAHFKTTKELNILDFSEDIITPSIFDQENSTRYIECNFIKSFITDFCKPIKRDEKIHTEYIATQIVTEFLKYKYKTNNNKSLDGILYKSSRNKNGKALVLFIGNGIDLMSLYDTEKDILKLINRQEKKYKSFIFLQKFKKIWHNSILYLRSL